MNSRPRLASYKAVHTAPKYVKRGFLREYGPVILAALVFALLYRAFLFQNYVVNMNSMYPTLHMGDYLVINKIIYRFSEPRAGDIVVFKSPIENRYWIKRIIGVPGDEVSVSEDGHVTRNGRVLDEGYARYGKSGFGPVRVKVPADSYFVMGDNRADSVDSRWFGPISRRAIVGKAVLLLFPASRFGKVQ